MPYEHACGNRDRDGFAWLEAHGFVSLDVPTLERYSI